MSERCDKCYGEGEVVKPEFAEEFDKVWDRVMETHCISYADAKPRAKKEFTEPTHDTCPKCSGKGTI